MLAFNWELTSENWFEEDLNKHLIWKYNSITGMQLRMLHGEYDAHLLMYENFEKKKSKKYKIITWERSVVNW